MNMEVLLGNILILVAIWWLADQIFGPTLDHIGESIRDDLFLKKNRDT